MYLLPAKRQCSPPMPKNSRKALLMTFAHKLRDDTARLAHAGAVRRVPNEGPRVSHELCEAILNALTRDDRLRRDYVHRRWLGLIGQASTANVAGRDGTFVGRSSTRRLRAPAARPWAL